MRKVNIAYKQEGKLNCRRIRLAELKWCRSPCARGCGCMGFLYQKKLLWRTAEGMISDKAGGDNDSAGLKAVEYPTLDGSILFFGNWKLCTI